MSDGKSERNELSDQIARLVAHLPRLPQLDRKIHILQASIEPLLHNAARSFFDDAWSRREPGLHDC
jgi:hypothetical protein